MKPPSSRPWSTTGYKSASSSSPSTPRPAPTQEAAPGNAFVGQGAGAASRSYAYYNQNGTQVAVLLLNGFRKGTGASGDQKAQPALALYCGA